MSSPAPDKADFTIGWVCALHIEYVAARAFLDHRYDISEVGRDQGDNNHYTMGKIGKHNVVITVCPAGEHGIAAAANAGRDLARSFRNVRLGLMVGVGGGIPSEAHDIRLGDVVVSCKDGKHSAVLQYDLRKKLADGTYEITSHMDNPPASLRAAVNGLRTQHDEDGNGIEAMVDEAIRRVKQRSKYTKPSAETDVLYSFEDFALPIKSDKAGKKRQRIGSIMRRDPRTEEQDNPAVHYGPIGSANTLMRDAKTRNKLRQAHGLLCVEMEAAGLMNHWPCLVVRGICDYADSHKNELWQGYAAMTAAAYAKSLLLQLGPSQVEATESMSTILELNKTIAENTTNLVAMQRHTISQDENLRAARLAQELNDEQVRCMRVLGQYDYKTFKDRNKKRLDGTCLWALGSPQFQGWLDGDRGSILWITADPGCGKSVLARSLVEDDIFRLHTTPVRICHFFFKDNDDQNDLSLAFCSILHQLFDQEPQLLRHALPAWRKDESKFVHEVDVLWSILLTACSDTTAPLTICLFDALDECKNDVPRQDRISLVSFLNTLHEDESRGRRPNLKIIATSRPYQSIEQDFLPLSRAIPNLRLFGENLSDQLRSEIDLVVEDRLLDLIKRWNLKDSTYRRLHNALSRIKNRTYLWLHLVFDFIDKQLEDSLRPDQCDFTILPDTVNAAYHSILNRAPREERGTMAKILKIIAAARRPLNAEQMAIVLGIADRPRGRTLAEVRLDETILVKRIRHLCGLFVVIDNSTFHLLHQTAKIFLLKADLYPVWIPTWNFSIVDAEAVMSFACIRFLILLSQAPKEDLATEMVASESMFSYAARTWAHHYRDSGFNADYIDVSSILYFLYNDQILKWFKEYCDHGNFLTEQEANGKMPISNVAAFLGHDNILRRLCQECRDSMESKTHDGSTPLLMAVRQRHYSTTMLLLDMGANVEAQSGYFGTPLGAAASWGDVGIIKRLLHHKANVNARAGRDTSPLSVAALCKNEEVVMLLLKSGANVSVRGKYCSNALTVASAAGDMKIAHLLLDHGADVNGRDDAHGSPLSAAAYWGQVEMVQLLISNGANINVEGDWINNGPLGSAAGQGHTKVVQLLLENHAEVNMGYEGFYGTPLCCAADGNHITVVRQLLKAGAVVNPRGMTYSNAACVAADTGAAACAAVLVDHIADGSDLCGITRAQYWAFLLDREPNAHDLTSSAALYCDFLGRSLLHFAAMNKQAQVISYYARHQSNVNVKDHFGWTPLHWAVYCSNLGAIAALCQLGADIWIRDKEQSSPVDVAIRLGSQALLDSILKIMSVNLSEYSEARQGPITDECCYCCGQDFYDGEYHYRACSEGERIILCHRCRYDAHQILPEYRLED